MPNVDIPPGSSVLVTGANGLIASNVAEEFLAAGYNVVGTVRSAARCGWLVPFFQARHSPQRGSFTLVEVPDLGDEHAFSSAYAAHHIAAACLTTSEMDFSQTEPEPFVSRAVETVHAPMRAALAHPHVKSFVLTSSVYAVYRARADDARTLTPETYNDEAVAAAHAATWTDPAWRGLAIFAASYVAKDRAAREFVQKNKPGFRATVLPVDAVMGRVLSVEKQGLPTTVGLVAAIWEGGDKAKATRAFVKPQYHVDVEDCAKLHVAAALRSDVVNERIFAFGEPFTWNRVLAIMKKRWPQRGLGDEDESEGECLATVPNKRGAELLGRPWASLEESVVKTMETARLV